MYIQLGGYHPWRPRGSQSGWEKRCDESFQARAKERLGKESEQTISKWSSECWLLIGHKESFVLLCAIGKQHLQFFLYVCTRQLLSRHTCLVRPPKKCQSGNFQFDINSSFQITISLVLDLWGWVVTGISIVNGLRKVHLIWQGGGDEDIETRSLKF